MGSRRCGWEGAGVRGGRRGADSEEAGVGCEKGSVPVREGRGCNSTGGLRTFEKMGLQRVGIFKLGTIYYMRGGWAKCGGGGSSHSNAWRQKKSPTGNNDLEGGGGSNAGVVLYLGVGMRSIGGYLVEGFDGPHRGGYTLEGV
eukprot:762075-Hanusia_phi.AAC.2